MNSLDYKDSASREPSHVEGRSRFGLTRLTLSLVGVFVGYRAFSWVAGVYLLRAFPSSTDRVALVASLAYPATTVFILLELLLVVWVYRPVTDLFTAGPNGGTETHSNIRDLLLGLGVGFLVFLVAIPFLNDLSTRTFVNTIIPSIHPLRPRSILYALLFWVALPITGEMVFRGIVLRTLQVHVWPIAAVLATTLLFVCIWPTFSIPVGVLLSIATSVLYRWRQSLVSPIVANSVMTVSAGTYVLWKIWS